MSSTVAFVIIAILGRTIQGTGEAIFMTYFVILLLELYPQAKSQALWAFMFSIQLGNGFGLLLEALLLIHFSEA